MSEARSSNVSRNSKSSKIAVKTVVAIILGIYLFLVVTGKIASNEKLGMPEYILIVFVLLLMTDFFDKIAEFSFGKEGLSFRLNSVEADQEQIQIALTGLVTKYEYKHLQSLSMPFPYQCVFGNIFFDEIRRLDSIDFIKPTQAYQVEGFNAIKNQHEHDPGDFDLKQYVEITNEGMSYLAIRKGM